MNIYCDKQIYLKIRKAFLAFTFLLIFEGVFRKWLLPQFSNVFLLIRDPFAAYVLYYGIKYNLIGDKLAKNMMTLGIICFFSALIFCHHNLLVALYGFRITFIYFPFMYICGNVLTKEDLLYIAKRLVLLMLIMVPVTILQFNSSQSSFINRGVGGDENGSGFSGGALGKYRPAGLFSFIAGLTAYYGVTFGFILYFLLFKDIATKLKLSSLKMYAILLLYIIGIPISISRTNVFQTIYILCFLIFLYPYKKQTLGKVFRIMLVFVPIIFFLLQIYGNTDFIQAFLMRFNGANESEGGVANSMFDRSFGYMFTAFSNDLIWIFGYGDGAFTNFGVQQIFSGMGRDAYLHLSTILGAEMEWGRIIAEEGPFLGIYMIMLRLLMSLTLLKKAFSALKRNNYLPILITPFASYFMLLSQLKSSYNLGFTSIAVTFVLIACRDNVQQLNKIIK